MSNSTKNQPKRKGFRVQRACFTCRKRKQGCEEERPCRRCVQKGIPCTESNPNRFKKAVPRKDDFITRNEEMKQQRIYEEKHETVQSRPSPRRWRFVPMESTETVRNINLNLPTLKKVEESQINLEIPSTPPEEIRQDSNLELNYQDSSSNHDSSQESNSPEEISDCDMSFVEPGLRVNLGLYLPFVKNPPSPRLSRCLDSGLTEDSEISTDFPFYTTSSPKRSSSIHEDNSFIDFWNEYLEKLEDNKFQGEFVKAKETWKEIISSLRVLDWPRVQSYLQELDMDQKVDTGPPPILFWSPGGRIHYANQTFCKLIGYTLDELRVHLDGKIHKGAHSLFHPEDMLKLLKWQLDAMQNPEDSLYEMRIRLISKDGKEISGSCSVASLRDALGIPLLTVAHFVPMTVSDQKPLYYPNLIS